MNNLTHNDLFDIDNLLKFSIDNNCSDINLIGEEAIYVRINGDIEKINLAPTNSSIINYIKKLTNSLNKQIEIYRAIAIDGSYILNYKNNKYYFRYNIALSKVRAVLTIRKLINKIPTFEEIQITTEKEKLYIEKIKNLENGLYLLVGATGSGKSTTIVTILDYVLKHNKIKVISLEDPIEYYFDNKYDNSFIVQREIGTDTKSFYSGIVEAMRQNPDIIFVGEIRDKDTAIAALNATLTGHVVLATLHTKSVEKTKDRLRFLLDNITNDFDFLSGIIYQKLAKNKNGIIEAVRDIYINN